MLHVNFLLILSSCCFAFCGHHLSPINRIAIVFSLLSSVSNFSMSHSSIFLISNISRSPLYIHLLPLCEFYPILLCHKGTSVLFPPPPDYWHTSFFFLVGLGPLHEIAVSAFSRSPFGKCKYVFIPISSLNPR